MTNRFNPLIGLLYRVLIMPLYPRSFRSEYGLRVMDEVNASLVDAQNTLQWCGTVFSLVVDGMQSAVRERMALRRTGSPANQTRGRGSGGWGTDLRFALRLYRKTPWFTALAVLTLSLGIGGNIAIFGIIEAVMLRALQYPDAQQLVRIWPSKYLSQQNVDWLRAETGSYAGVTAADNAVLTITDGGEPTEVRTVGVAQGHFSTIGIPPMLGRTFANSEHDPGQAPVMILSHELWTERFGRDSTVIGSTIAVSGQNATHRTVVGIMPPGYRSVSGAGFDAWVPIVFDRSLHDYGNAYGLVVIGRLAPGTSVSNAQAEITTFATSVGDRLPGQFSAQTVAEAGVVPLQESFVADIRARLVALMVAAFFVLIIGCTNVATLMLARNASRQREITIRTALGASRGRVIRQLCVESAVMGATGGSLGILIAWWGRDFAATLLPGVPRDAAVAMNPTLATFAVGITMMASFIAGVWPGLSAANSSPATALQSSRVRGSTRRLRQSQIVMLTMEVALATMLSFGAALLFQTVNGINKLPAGLDPENVMTFRMTVPNASDREDATVKMFEDVRQQVAQIPGISAVGLVSRLPMGGGLSRISVTPEGFEIPPNSPYPSATHRLISPGYFDAIGATLLSGRDLTESDTREGPLYGVVNLTFANRFWGGDAIGKRLAGRDGTVWMEIVGVVADIREEDITGSIFPAVYIPHRDWPWQTMSFTVRTDLNPDGLTVPLKEAVWRVNPDAPVTRMRTMRQVLDTATEGPRLMARLAGIFAALALMLGAVGVAGVVAHTVADRQSELGLRAALGATRRNLMRFELQQTGRVIGLGLVVGTVGALGVGTLLETMIFDVAPRDPGLLLAATVTQLGVGLAAAWIPTLRGTAVSPVDSLRRS